MDDGRKSVALAVVGATATGKSAAVAALARQRPVEVVCCDSVQVYRGFDVGSAKPSAAERARVPHHLVDIVAWHQGFDAAQFAARAAAAIAAIQARGALAVVCGGTGLYLRALRHGLAPLPPVDAALRAALLAAEAVDPGAALRRLVRLDPAGAAALDPRNVRRVLRALEICLQTGAAASAVRRRPPPSAPALQVLQLVWPDPALRQRIVARAEAMLTGGLVAEVAALLAAGVAPDCPPMRSVGYRQAAAVVRGEAPLAGLGTRIATATWQYARRQRTWLRREPDVAAIPVDAPAAAAAAVVAAARLL